MTQRQEINVFLLLFVKAKEDSFFCELRFRGGDSFTTVPAWAEPPLRVVV
jgi:hypothetical protein